MTGFSSVLLILPCHVWPFRKTLPSTAGHDRDLCLHFDADIGDDLALLACFVESRWVSRSPRLQLPSNPAASPRLPFSPIPQPSRHGLQERTDLPCTYKQMEGSNSNGGRGCIRSLPILAGAEADTGHQDRYSDDVKGLIKSICDASKRTG